MFNRIVRAATALACVASSGAALSQAYPGNDLLWRQQQTTRNYIITESVPTECRNAVYTAAMTWANSTVNVRFVWAGYVNGYAWAYDSTTKKNFSLSTNTLDTWVQVGTPDTADAWGEVQPRYPASGGYNATANPQWTAIDADHIINNNRIGEFHCYSSTPVPDTKRDMQSHGLHEYGHVWGLGHDSGATNTTAVMYEYGLKGTAGTKRSLLPRDIARGQYIYGSK